jgi:hypothetical protein
MLRRNTFQADLMLYTYRSTRSTYPSGGYFSNDDDDDNHYYHGSSCVYSSHVEYGNDHLCYACPSDFQ